ncbi:MAG: hypothetical protein ACREB8_13955 [Pseudolabrys sp.]
MLGKLARAAYVVFVAGMFVAWAFAWATAASKSGPVEPAKDPPPVERWYS